MNECDGKFQQSDYENNDYYQKSNEKFLFFFFGQNLEENL